MQPSFPPERNFIDDLVSYFNQKMEVRAAYFAFLYSETTKTHDLFLGVEHTGELESIKAITLLLKKIYLQDAPLFFASSEEEPDTFELVKDQGMAFFGRQEELVVEQHLLKQLFDKQENTAALSRVVGEHEVYALVNKEQLAQKTLVLPSFSKGAEVFTPLFTSPAMVAQGGMTSLPAGLTLAKLTWNRHLAGSAPRPVVLNPDTAFAAKFYL